MQKFTPIQFLKASSAQSDAHLIGNHGVLGSIPTGSSNSSFMEIDHEIFSTVIISLPVIPEGQLLVSA